MRSGLALLVLAVTLPFVDVAGAASSPKRPRSADAFDSAIALSRGGSPDAAVAAWSRLVRENPKSPEVRNNLAVALARAGRRAEARTTLHRAAALQPKYASIQRNLESPEDQWLMIERVPGRTGERSVAMTRREAEALLGPADPPLPPEPSVSAAASTTSSAVATDAQDALRQWAAAWQARDVEAYLAAYHPEFAVPAGADRRGWEAERRKRIEAKAWIRVGVREPQWSSADDGTTAVVRFTQDYEASSLRERSRKQITWRQAGSAWRIVEERTLAR